MPTPHVTWTGGPNISGSSLVTSTLSVSGYSATGSGETVTGYTFQWYRGGGAISGATSSSYATNASDIGYYINCIVTAQGSLGDTASGTSSSIGPIYENSPVNTAAPNCSPTGAQVIGTHLTTSNGSWSSYTSPSFTYYWYRNFVTYLGGGTGYTLTSADYEGTVACYVVASNTHGNAGAWDTNGADCHSATPVCNTSPSISGTKQVGSALSCSTGAWEATYAPSPTGYQYQWMRDGHGNGSFSNIGGATSSSYTLTDSDDGCQMYCIVTATSGSGNTNAGAVAYYGLISQPAPSNSVAPVASGTATVAQTLSATTGTWSSMTGYNPVYHYQWQRDNLGGGTYSNIPGAVNSTYMLQDGDDQCNIRCVVTADNTNATNVSANSNTIGLVVEPAPVNVTAPTINGAAALNIGLTCSTGIWNFMAGHDPSYTYQWQHSVDGSTWTDVSGATSPSYVPVSTDLGDYIRCVVAAHNSGSA